MEKIGVGFKLASCSSHNLMCPTIGRWDQFCVNHHSETAYAAWDEAIKCRETFAVCACMGMRVRVRMYVFSSQALYS